MTVKKSTRGGSSKAARKGLVLYHGIKIAVASGKRSKVSKLLQRELKHRSEARGERKSA